MTVFRILLRTFLDSALIVLTSGHLIYASFSYSEDRGLANFYALMGLAWGVVLLAHRVEKQP